MQSFSKTFPGVIRLCLLLCLAALPLRVFALEIDEAFFAPSKPIFYGEESFRKRLAEKSTDKPPLGILLSGGSARAYAHIGVLRRLEEAGIKPDFIVANSMGSIVGMLYAAGLSPDQIEAMVISTPMAELFQPVLPLKGGILDTSRFMDMLHDMFGDLDIKNLPIPIIVVCDDLITHRQIWMTEGDFYPIFRAAFSMPVFFNPVPYGDFMLVDGGTTNLVPVDVLAEFTDRYIVATTFNNNTKVNFTNPVTVLHQNISIAKERNAREMLDQYRPLVIRCDVEDISFMDYFMIKQIAERGYRSTDEKIPLILQKFGTNPNDLTAVRDEMSIKQAKTKRKVELGTPFFRHGKRFFVTAAVQFPDSFHSPYHFIKEPFALMSASTGIGYLGVRGGISNPFTEVNPAGSLFFQVGPVGKFDLSSFHQVNQDYIYSQATLSGRFFMPYPVGWFPFVDTEIMNDHSFSVLDGYHRAGVSVRRIGASRIKPELSIYGFDRNEEIYGVGGEASLVISPIYPLAFRTRAMGRHGLSDNQAFAIFANDGYRGILPHGTKLPQAVINGEVALNADKLSIGLAETLLIQRFDAALYLDSLQGATQAYAAGVSVTGSISLIGLTPFTATVYAGYDLTAGEPFVTFKAGTLFQ